MKGRARIVVAYLAGLVFAVGLGVGGMTRPEKVLGFLDFFGQWDPSLAFVMGGALAVYGVAYRWSRRRAAPVLGGSFFRPPQARLDGRLIAGATIFGVGWGLGGYCPAPGITSIVSGGGTAIAFAAAMLLGIVLHRVVTLPRWAQRRVDPPTFTDDVVLPPSASAG